MQDKFPDGMYLKLIKKWKVTGAEKGRVYQVDNKNSAAKNGQVVLRKISKQDGSHLKYSVRSNTLLLDPSTFDTEGYHIKQDGSRGKRYFKPVHPDFVEETNGETRSSKAVDAMMK